MKINGCFRCCIFLPHTIHVWYIDLHFIIKIPPNVGKYTKNIHGMGTENSPFLRGYSVFVSFPGEEYPSLSTLESYCKIQALSLGRRPPPITKSWFPMPRHAVWWRPGVFSVGSLIRHCELVKPKGSKDNNKDDNRRQYSCTNCKNLEFDFDISMFNVFFNHILTWHSMKLQAECW